LQRAVRRIGFHSAVIDTPLQVGRRKKKLKLSGLM
jgi:hypothetical protein